jgi:hypothetical protein
MDETTASTVGTGALDIERSAALQCRSTSHVKKQLSTQKTYASLEPSGRYVTGLYAVHVTP